MSSDAGREVNPITRQPLNRNSPQYRGNVDSVSFAFRSIGTRNSDRLSGVWSREGLMTLNHVDDAEHWRERAAQMRVLATTMKQIEAQAIMARLAEHYDNLADRAELRANGEVPPGGW